MELQSVQKINTNIAILPAGDTEISFSLRDIEAIIGQPEIEMAPPPINVNAAKITSISDQVEIIVGQGRIQINDRSNIQPGTDRFTVIINGITSLFADISNFKYRAFGWNFAISFKLPLDRLPAQMIAERFINREELRRKGNLDIAGAGVRLFYTKDPGYCHLRLEPKENKLDSELYFARINVHFNITDRLPEQEALEKSFRSEYDDFIKVVSTIFE